jgi:hypothetical protein
MNQLYKLIVQILCMVCGVIGLAFGNTTGNYLVLLGVLVAVIPSDEDIEVAVKKGIGEQK